MTARSSTARCHWTAPADLEVTHNRSNRVAVLADLATHLRASPLGQRSPRRDRRGRVVSRHNVDDPALVDHGDTVGDQQDLARPSDITMVAVTCPRCSTGAGECTRPPPRRRLGWAARPAVPAARWTAPAPGSAAGCGHRTGCVPASRSWGCAPRSCGPVDGAAGWLTRGR
jgi:hypothetical protein